MSKAVDSLARSVEKRLSEIETRDNQILKQLQLLTERVNLLERVNERKIKQKVGGLDSNTVRKVL